MNSMDFAPPGASQPLVKPIDVDDAHRGRRAFRRTGYEL